jgi:hypothetical protein
VAIPWIAAPTSGPSASSFFELLTGRHLYGGGATLTDTLAAVILKDHDYSALPPDTPPRVRRLLERCLRKDPKQRLRDIGEARVALHRERIAGGGRRRVALLGARFGELMFAARTAAASRTECRVEC